MPPPSDPHDPLAPLLRRWSESPRPAPGLTHEIWRRIALGESAATSPAGVRAVIEAWFARPPFAVLFVVSCALLGLFLAEVRAGRHEHARNAQLARHYLQLIDPLLNEPATPSRP